MSQDIISDTLNQIMNAKRARKNFVIVKRHSKFLAAVLEIAKKHGYIIKYKVKEREMEIEFNLNECGTIKPRFDASVKDIEKYIKRFLPARDFGIIILSTNKGLMTHIEAYEKKIGGSLIAYFY